MSETVERLKDELGRLSPQERAELADFLIRSLDEGADPDAEAAWDAELERRAAEIKAGNVVGLPADEVFKRRPEGA
jgi:putative addiction module component (TIGR02574 family)